MMTNGNPIFSMEHVEISYQESGQQKVIVQDISLELFSGEMVALIGPSGCGKSITAHAMVGLLDNGFRVTNGEILYKEATITDYDEKQLQRFRRDEIALLIQHSLNGLDPIRTVKKQMVETAKQKKKWNKNEIEVMLHTLLKKVGFLDPKPILAAYPFELSGGMRQRVLLAMMLSLQPKILIADEPTTSLDVINRNKVLALLKELQQELGLTIFLITHDEKSIRKYADRVIYMDQGGIVI